MTELLRPHPAPDDVVSAVAASIREGRTITCVLRAGPAEGRSTALRDLHALIERGPEAQVVLSLRCGGPERAPLSLVETIFAVAGLDSFRPDVAAAKLPIDILAGLSRRWPGQRVGLLIDDAHWADTASAAVLGALAEGPPPPLVAIVLTAPSGVVLPPSLAGVPSLALSGPTNDDARALLGRRAAQAPHAVLDELITLCYRNPLVLREAATALTDDQLAGRVPLPRHPPLGPESLRVFGRPVADLPAATRDWLLLLALTGDDLTTALRTGAALHWNADDLAPAEQVGLVRTSGGGVRWLSPLVAHAIVATAQSVESRRVSQALARAYDPELRPVAHARHTAAGHRDTASEQVAIRHAVVTLAAGGRLLDAYEAALQGMRIAPDYAQRRHFLTTAAELCWLAGYTDYALELLGDPDGAPRPKIPADERSGLSEDGDGSAQVLRWIVEGTCESWPELKGSPMVGEEPSLAARLLGTALLAGWENTDPHKLASVVRDLGGLPTGTRAARPDAVGALARVVDGHSALADTQHDALQSLSWWLHPADALHPKAWPPPLLPVFLGAESRYDQQFSRLLGTAYVRAAPSQRALLLLKRANTRSAAGRWSQALEDAVDGAALAERIGQPALRAQLLQASAWIHASRGDAVNCAGDLEAARVSGPSVARQWHLLWIRGLAALGAGQADEALDQLQELHHGALRSPHHLVVRRLSTADLATAAVWARRPHDVDTAMDEFAKWAARGAAPWVHLDLARCRALISGVEAQSHHVEALALAGDVARPASTARARLEYGAWLRRAKRHREARGELRAAETAFAQLAATAWQQRAHDELRAAGEVSPATPGREMVVSLTAQEERIAELAAAGLSNRQIAGLLMLSPRTVGYHLHKIFPKLDVTSRAQLGRALGERLPGASRG